ncbi:unnamed protein product [Mytilus coruscus]|uniref:Uncharacterized protein n=1 Tax=Mytilus coruscus TaxID=42192 RepID=A0A6J8F0Z9_MYTCO|nr:unnamed protein product [Mytilus coruscus]
MFEYERSTERQLIGLKSSETIPGKPFEKLECPESLLILFRSGIFTIDKTSLVLNICESHRVELGLNWRRGKVKCTYPDHNDRSRAKADLGANPTVCKEVWLKTRQIVPIGSEICKQCSTQHKKTVSSHLEVNFEDKLVRDSCSDDVMDTESSELFSCYTAGNSQEKFNQDWLEELRTPREKLNKAMKILCSSFEPLQSQLQKPWNTIRNSMRSYYLKKAFECVEIILSIIAPDQKNFLLESLYKKSYKTQEMPEIDQTTKIIINAYNNVTDSRTQTQLLSLIVNSFNKAELQKLIPSVSLFKIDSARTLYMQESSQYTKVSAKNAILKPLAEHLYTGFLKYVMLRNKRALQGLDNITAAGMNSIDILSKLVQKLETFGMSKPEFKYLTDIIQLINQFLKYEYKSHLNRLDGCTDHCTIMALSDPTESKLSASCNHNHERQCEKCSMVESCLDMIHEKLTRLKSQQPSLKR